MNETDHERARTRVSPCFVDQSKATDTPFGQISRVREVQNSGLARGYLRQCGLKCWAHDAILYPTQSREAHVTKRSESAFLYIPSMKIIRNYYPRALWFRRLFTILSLWKCPQFMQHRIQPMLSAEQIHGGRWVRTLIQISCGVLFSSFHIVSAFISVHILWGYHSFFARMLVQPTEPHSALQVS